MHGIALVMETEGMREDAPGLGGPLGPLELIKRLVGVTPSQCRTPSRIA